MLAWLEVVDGPPMLAADQERKTWEAFKRHIRLLASDCDHLKLLKLNFDISLPLMDGVAVASSQFNREGTNLVVKAKEIRRTVMNELLPSFTR